MPEAVTLPKVNITRLASTADCIFKSLMPPKYLRLESFISTDRLFYKAKDVIFIEVLLIDTMSKKPFVSGTDFPRDVSVNIQIFGAFEELLANSSITTSTLGPTAAFSYKLPSDTYNSDYMIVAKGVDFAPSHKKFFVREIAENIPTQTGYSLKVDFFNHAFSPSENIYGKVILLKDGMKVNLTGLFFLIF